MISCYFQNKSAQKQKIRMYLQENSAVKSMNCCQVQNLKIHYDDVTYQKKIINRIMLCGIIVSYKDGLSPTKKPIRIIKLRDSTGIAYLQLFQSSQWNLIPDLVKLRNKPYVTVCVQAKVQGQFKFQIKLTVMSFSVVKDYNQVSLHMMSVIKNYIALKS